MANTKKIDPHVIIECPVSVELALEAYLRNHDIVALLELVHGVIDAHGDPKGEHAAYRNYKAAQMLDELIDRV